jgi:prophage regulatory protein
VAIRYLTYPELKAKFNLPLGKRQLHRLADEGKFPKPVKFSYRREAWIESEIVAWLAQRHAMRRAA